MPHLVGERVGATQRRGPGLGHAVTVVGVHRREPARVAEVVDLQPRELGPPAVRVGPSSVGVGFEDGDGRERGEVAEPGLARGDGLHVGEFLGDVGEGDHGRRRQVLPEREHGVHRQPHRAQLGTEGELVDLGLDGFAVLEGTPHRMVRPVDGRAVGRHDAQVVESRADEEVDARLAEQFDGGLVGVGAGARRVHDQHALGEGVDDLALVGLRRRDGVAGLQQIGLVDQVPQHRRPTTELHRDRRPFDQPRAVVGADDAVGRGGSSSPRATASIRWSMRGRRRRRRAPSTRCGC